MKRMKGKHLLLALCLAAALLLASCGPKPASSQGSPQSSSMEDSSGSEEEENVPTETIQGTVNLVDKELGLLVLVADETYYRFDTASADLSDLTPGTSVTVTYTGTLEPDSDFVTAVLVSVAVDSTPST